jgi:hypothetical protein
MEILVVGHTRSTTRLESYCSNTSSYYLTFKLTDDTDDLLHRYLIRQAMIITTGLCTLASCIPNLELPLRRSTYSGVLHSRNCSKGTGTQ